MGQSGSEAYLPDDGEAGVQVGQASGGQRGAAGGELQERLPLVRRHPAQNSDEALEAGTEERSGGLISAAGNTDLNKDGCHIFTSTYW